MEPMTDKPKPTIEMITFKQLCTELKVNPREAGEASPRRARHKEELRARQGPQAGAGVGVAEEFTSAERSTGGAHCLDNLPALFAATFCAVARC
jgi:hypothetical protein